jgi:hypothetical protein
VAVSVVVCFPWGAGGNLIRNIIGLDPEFEFCTDKADRYKWLYDYYTKPVTSETWLQREWSIRQQFYNKYYLGGITYWNPEYLLAYDCHGTSIEISAIETNNQLLCYDRYKIDRNQRTEQVSPWRLQDCEYIFVLPNNINSITDIYHSKNPSLNQFNHIVELERKKYALDANSKLHNNLQTLANKLVNKHTYIAEDLFQSPNIILDIVSKLNLNISAQQITNIHSKWLQTTREVYYNYYNRELTL